MPIPDDVFERLRRELGDAVARPPADHAPDCAAIVSAADAQEAATTLALCSTAGWRVIFAGGGSWPGRAAGCDVLVRTDRMRGVIDYEPADLTAHVRAGTPVATLAATFAAHRQQWPVDAPASEATTIGGALAVGAAGPARYAHGTPRDHVLGLELVTGDGRVLELGGRVVKNVAGYDLVRLATGSRGTLGLITRAHLRLRALPDADVTALYLAAQPGPLVELVGRADDAWPTALELLSPTVAHAVVGEVRWALLVRCTGNREFVADARARLVHVEPDRCVLLDADAASTAWQRLNAAECEAEASVRISAPAARLDRALDAALELCQPDAGRWRIAAHAGNGIVRAWRADALDADRTTRLADAIAALRATLAPHRIEIHLTVPDRDLPRGFEAALRPPRIAALERGIRRVFDPAGILGPANGRLS